MSEILEDSNRTVNENAQFLTIQNCVITGEEVAQYKGSDLQYAVARKLDPEKTYNVYRPLAEIEKALPSFNGLPLLNNHIPISSIRPEKTEWIGCVGTEGRLEGKELVNTVSVWLDSAIKNIEAADKTQYSNRKIGKKDLSAGYAFQLRDEKGVFEGKSYDFVMHGLEGNHVALVEDGRHPTAMVADHNSLNKEINMANNKTSLLQKLYRKLVSIAQDENGEYEGRENEKIGEIKGAVEQLEKIQHAETGAMDESEAEKEREDEEGEKEEKEQSTAKDRKRGKAKDRKSRAKDEEKMEADCHDEEDNDDEPMEDRKGKARDKKAKARDEESEEKEESKAMDSNNVKTQVDEIVQAYVLSNKVIGKLSPTFIQDCKYSADAMLSKALTLKGMAHDGKSVEAKLAMMEVLAKQGTGAPTIKMALDSNKTSKKYNNARDFLNEGNK